MKKCYICLPITNHEDSLFDRADIACEEVRKMGYIPITPMEINGETRETIHEHDKNGWIEMGRDIQTLLECDAIFCCKGFLKSKGCMAEYNCAKIYNKQIFYQKGNPQESLAHNLKAEYLKLTAKYNEVHKNSVYADIYYYKTKIRELMNEAHVNYNLYWDIDSNEFIEMPID